MSYKVLSLKWRPQQFKQVEGQDPIQKVLTNAIQNNTLHPALIFSGTKGTGKTSTARIVAKSLKCEKTKGAEPCNKCPSCISITEGSNMDVIEIDGASNNGVDAIRDLKNSVQYMPTQGSKRIYIIDEVHMLTGSAFNALLKTLEEPPSHVTFIMATTELKKIPATVISRCQIFYFRPISVERIKSRVEEIAKVEKIQIDEEALWLIAEQANHSMRDAQVLLDQMACVSGRKINAESIVNILALTPKKFIYQALSAIVQRDVASVLSLLPSISSIDCEDFMKQLLAQIRNLLMITLKTKNPSALTVTKEKQELFKNLSEKTSSEDLHFLFDMCLKGCADLKNGFDPHITLEMVLLRMCNAPRLESIFENENASDEQHMPIRNKKVSPTKTEKKASPPTLTAQSWTQFIQLIEGKDGRLAAELKSFSLQSFSKENLVLGYKKSLAFIEEKIKNPQFKKQIQACVQEHFNISPVVQFTFSDDTNFRTKEIEQQTIRDDEKIKEALKNPVAQQVQELFQAKVVNKNSIFNSEKN